MYAADDKHGIADESSAHQPRHAQVAVKAMIPIRNPAITFPASAPSA